MKTRFAIRSNQPVRSVSAVVLGAALAACSGSGDSDNTVAVNGDVPIAYTQRANTLGLNPTDGTPFAAGGDLMIREKSSPSAKEHNITAAYTRGVGDVSDPEVSYDGKKIVFAMNCPSSNNAAIGSAACTGRWNIWEYTLPAKGYEGGTFRRITSSATDDDVDPYYLPGGGFVFASNRQGKTSVLQGQAINAQPYFALDEYERERVLNLHTMGADGSNIRQISANQSHDRNPVVRDNGNIMFSRWEHVGPKNRFAVFQVKPDGTDMFVFYGALSPGNSFLHPREMDPAGAYQGQLASSLMSLSGTQEGGALMMIDAANYSENNAPAHAGLPAGQGQRQVTQQALNDERGFSLYGRVTTPYPLWDGTNRVLGSYRPCEVQRTEPGKPTAVVSCAILTQEERDALGNNDEMRGAPVTLPSGVQLRDNVPASYAVYMFDLRQNTQQIVAAPPAGFMYVDPIALQPRRVPQQASATAVDEDLARQDKGLIEVRSVYDTDGLNRMGNPMLAVTEAERPASCNPGVASLDQRVGIVQTAPPADPAETRASVPDLRRMKDPADPAYQCAPARFVRAFRAVAPPSNMMGGREAIGETEFEQQQILGYAPVEPDGSFKLQVPADTPLGLAIVDSKGRAIQTHLNWIQVRPGERRTCDGCHSPRRGASLNSGPVVDPANRPTSWLPTMVPQQGETMASTRTRLDPSALQLRPDMESTDIWANPAAGGVPRPSLQMRYTGNANPADDLATAVPSNGLINYEQHIAPLWERPRGANTCTNCHNGSSGPLDLRSTTSGTGRYTSYEELLVGDPVIDPDTGLPQIEVREGVPEVVRGVALVDTEAPNALGMTRASRLGEILYGEVLKAGPEALQAHPNPPPSAPNHAAILNKAELRLVTEWIDLGGQYFNDPFNSGAMAASQLSETVFESSVLPILSSTCAASCHQAGGLQGTPTPGTSFQGNRFVLTGSPEGDYNVTLSMISDTCNPASNYLLLRPSTAPHPSGGTAAALPVGSQNYNTIRDWIASGCGAGATSARAGRR
ncbi:MAG: hypothetical protein HS128_05155 [Ideonella sp.]|nr:hypothetical protein [Ideonella sp.]MCC7458961.1 hypothetical protein [Nitrospira sp.]